MAVAEKGILVTEPVCVFTVMEVTGFKTCGKTAWHESHTHVHPDKCMKLVKSE